jgi:hypothetical protein
MKSSRTRPSAVSETWRRCQRNRERGIETEAEIPLAEIFV